MKKTSAALLAAMVSAACAGSGGGSSEGGEGIVDFTAQLQATAGYQVRGLANAVASLGRTAVTVEIQGGTPGATYPWHVHQGRCGSNGPIVGAGSDYPAIRVDADGSERAVATLTQQLNDDTEYFVNVHLSAQQMNVIVACGALVD
jgi:Cu-Zn family superoxide dismutase